MLNYLLLFVILYYIALNYLFYSFTLARAGPLRGVLFERLAHRKLLKGGNFQCRNLIDKGGAFEVILSPSSSVMFNKIDEVSHQSDGVYAMPRATNFAAVDALVQVGCTTLARIVNKLLLKSLLPNYNYATIPPFSLNSLTRCSK